jgi:hypothetical protein
MPWRKFSAGMVAASSLASAGTVAVDSEINPYEVSDEKYELASVSTIEAAGENKVEAHRDRPAVTLSKWNGEAAMTVAYGDINAEGSRQFLTDRVEWKGDTEELHAYPLPAAEGMEDGGFEIEVYLRERPASNDFRFDIEGAEELDFFYQPELTPEEIEAGAVRPENVVGSYAVFHKTKANHRVGDTNYATGKAYHIYRPKAFAADGSEVWAELAYADGVLTVTVPEKWLESAVYPVRVDPTFGNTTVGASFGAATGLRGNQHTSPSDAAGANLVSISVSGRRSTVGTLNISAALYNSGTTLLVNQSAETTTDGSSGDQWWIVSMNTFSLSASTNYRLMIWPSTAGGLFGYNFDSCTNCTLSQANTGLTYNTWPNPATFVTTIDNLYSLYATYTVAGGGAAPAPDNGIIWFE